MNHITNQNVLMAMFPLVTNEVCRAEQSVLTGASKLEAVVQAVKVIYQQTSAPLAFDALQSMLERMVEAVVAYFNNVGSFAHQPQMMSA